MTCDHEEDNNRRKILKWLSPDDYDETHERHWKKRFDNTGEWLIDDDRFSVWMDTENSGLLWCYGARRFYYTLFTTTTDANINI